MDLQRPSSMPIGEPVAFLHRMDCLRGEAIVTVCDRPSLRRATFLDGRENFWRAERLIPLVPMGTGATPTRRFIFHVGFTGSTLLARLLDDPGRILVLKEPQCLADIAGQRSAIADGKGIASVEALVDHALGRLGDLGGGDVPVLVKPTNWANCLLRELCRPARKTLAVFLTMPRRDFLVAVFRGGRERLAFCARLAADMAALDERGTAALNAAISHSQDPLDQMARITALLHYLQEHEFAAARKANGWDDSVVITLGQLLDDPVRAAARARQTLDLPKTAKDARRARHVLKMHAKNPKQPFSSNERADENCEIEQLHGPRFDAAFDWLDGQNLPR